MPPRSRSTVMEPWVRPERMTKDIFGTLVYVIFRIDTGKPGSIAPEKVANGDFYRIAGCCLVPPLINTKLFGL